MANETPVLAHLQMDRSDPIGNSEDIDQRRALHVKIKNKISEPIQITMDPASQALFVQMVALLQDIADALGAANNLVDQSGNALVDQSGNHLANF